MTHLQTTEQETAAEMLRKCAEKAAWRLQQSEPDVRTIAIQMRETAKLALAEIDRSGAGVKGDGDGIGGVKGDGDGIGVR